MKDGNDIDGRWRDALCPACGQPASKTTSIGWTFVCHPCNGRKYGYGGYGYDAQVILHDARRMRQIEGVE